MTELHVGRGTTRGALSVFPVWGEYVRVGRCTSRLASVRLGENVEGPKVGSVLVTNLGDRPVVMFEGQVLEGGWQNRMLGGSVVVPALDELPVDVVCVEQGRWGGGRVHRMRGRRASARVRGGLRSAGDRQGEVWSRVAAYEDRYGPNATGSFCEHADRAYGDVARMVEGQRPLPGQVGVVIGIGGQPVVAEVFASGWLLAGQFRSIVAAAAMDAVGAAAVETPSRRVRRFLDRAAGVGLGVGARAGLGVWRRGASDFVDVSALEWQGRPVHRVLLNRRHELNGVAV
jgi:hypothetical protein